MIFLPRLLRSSVASGHYQLLIRQLDTLSSLLKSLSLLKTTEPKWLFSITTSFWSFVLLSMKAYKFTVCGRRHETTHFILRVANSIPFTIWINKSIPRPKKNVNYILLWFWMLQFKLLCQRKPGEGGGFETTKQSTLTFDSRQTVNSDPDVTCCFDKSVSANWV